MPLYEWECDQHGRFEAFFKLADKPATAMCPKCAAESRQIFTVGGVQGDELPSWFNAEARGCLQNSGEKPIESRTEYRNYLEKRGVIETSAHREF